MPSYQYSVEVDQEIVKSVGCFTTLPIRISARSQFADELCHQFLKDLQDTCDSATYSTSLSQSPVGTFTALLYPECLPDRIRPVVNLANLMFFFDGINHPVNASVEFPEADIFNRLR